MSQSIRKVIITAYGDESNVVVRSIEINDPKPDEVQVRVEYSGFNGADINMRLGRYPMQRKPPFSPGYCLVGRIVQHGSLSDKYPIGTVVAALTIYEAEAQLANVPERYLIPVPEYLDHGKACAMMLDWTTAYAMVFHTAKVRLGQRVFVHGLSGAVGLATATLCRQQGAEVYGTASMRHHDLLQSLGFHPFVYTDKKWIEATQALGGMDVVFDPLGYESYDESYGVLAKYGLVVGYGTNLATINNEPDRGTLLTIVKLLARNLLSPVTTKHTTFAYVSRDSATFKADVLELFRLLGAQEVDVRIKGIFTLDNIVEAHRSWVSGGQGIGSFLIKINASDQ